MAKMPGFLLLDAFQSKIYVQHTQYLLRIGIEMQ